MRKFVIFYGDDTVYEGGGESDEMVEVTFRVSRDWINAPVDGLQGVVYEDAKGEPRHWNNVDNIVMLPEGLEIYGTSDLGPFLREHMRGIVKFGLCVSQERYEHIQQEMKDYSWKTYQEKIKPQKRKFQKNE